MMSRSPLILLVLVYACANALLAQDVVRYQDFGAKGDGKTDDFEALIKAHEHANEKGLPVRAEDGATYYIGGAAKTIPVETSTNFGKAGFIIDDVGIEDRRKHVFEIRSKQRPVQIKGIDSLKRGQTSIQADLPGPCLITVRDDSTKRFIRRGLNPNSGSSQTDVFLVDGRGRVDPRTPVIWDFKQLSSIEARPLDEEVLSVKGGHFTTIANQAKSEYNYHSRGIAVRRSNVVIEGLEHHVKGEGETGAPYRGFIDISGCANVLVRDCILTGHKTYRTMGRANKPVSMGTYDMHINKSVNVTFKNVTQTNDIMDRKYWGIMGSNFCKNLTYDNCKLSRFDAHQGVTNATIKDSILGYMALRLTGFGTFTIENSTVQSRAFIVLRPDYGSTWNGDIVIRNCRYIPTSRKPAIIEATNDGKHDFGYTCHLPTHIHIDGLKVEDGKLAKDYKGLAIFNNPDRGYKEGAELPHPPVITKEVVHRGVVSQSGKPLRLSDNMAMFKGVKVTEAK